MAQIQMLAADALASPSTFSVIYGRNSPVKNGYHIGFRMNLLFPTVILYHLEEVSPPG